MALIIEKAKPTLTRVELYLSTFISRRNNDLREANYQSQREEGKDEVRGKTDLFDMQIQTQKNVALNGPGGQSEREEGRQTLPLESGGI